MSLKPILRTIVPRGFDIKAILRSIQPWAPNDDMKFSLDAAGLVALADLSMITHRTALTGTSALLDTFILCPGIHRQQNASELNGGEYPAVAAMTSGFVFRVENPATVSYLQQVGLTGHLTTLSITNIENEMSKKAKILSIFYTFQNATLLSTSTYITAVLLTMIALILLTLSNDWWGLFVIFLLMFARFSNTTVLRRRSQAGWKGASEPGVQGDLLILLSQDRWLRMRGAVDDLKAVTSGQWLRDMTFAESSITTLTTILIYLDAALASNAKQSGKALLLTLLTVSTGLLSMTNKNTTAFQMHGRIIKVDGPRKRYARRLDMVKQLIKETGRSDWALRIGAIVSRSDQDISNEIVAM